VILSIAAERKKKHVSIRINSELHVQRLAREARPIDVQPLFRMLPMLLRRVEVRWAQSG
jgi:hypothetical protein